LGYVQSAQLTNVHFVDQRLHMFSFFGQDDFKVTPKLTLNVGLRYEIPVPKEERHHHNSNFCPTCPAVAFNGVPGAMIYAGVNGAPDHFGETRTNAFGPRLGVAYQLNSKTVIRTGSAIYYQPAREDGNADNGIQGFGGTFGSIGNSLVMPTCGKSLRMIWRRWKKKANNRICGKSVTPFGPKWLDRFIGKAFNLKGDFVGDYRLISYFVSLMSTGQSHALDGTIGNCDRLKRDLSEMGTFDAKMSTYLLYRLREFAVMGFSGFEGRHYSLFENLEEDMGQAVSIQALITALAFKYIAKEGISHQHIPDDPSI